MKISLIGYMGSGKSTVAAALAEKLSIPFIDLDRQIEIATSKTISDLFKEGGEIKFRKTEKEVLTNVLNSDAEFVLATGGGTPVYFDNMDLINEYTTSVYLRAKPQELSERLLPEKSVRPLIAHLPDESMPEFVAKHLFERRNFYEQSHLTIDIGSKSAEEITEEIIRLLNLQK